MPISRACPIFAILFVFAGTAFADPSGVGLPADAARLPFGLPDAADPLGGLGRPRDVLDDRIRGDFDMPLFRLGPDGRARPADPVAPAAPVRTPPPDPRPARAFPAP